MNEADYRPYDALALSALKALLARWAGTAAGDFPKLYLEVAHQRGLDQLFFDFLAESDGREPGETLDAISEQLADLAATTDLRYRQAKRREQIALRAGVPRGPKPQHKVEVTPQLWYVHVWADLLLAWLQWARVVAIPPAALAADGAAVLDRYYRHRPACWNWESRIDLEQLRFGSNLLIDQLMGAGSAHPSKAESEQAFRRLGISQLSRQQQKLWLARHGFMEVANPYLERRKGNNPAAAWLELLEQRSGRPA